MAYKLSERKIQNRMRQRRLVVASKLASGEEIDWGDIATVFMIFGVLSLFTSWLYSFEVGKPIQQKIFPNQTKSSTEIGPVIVGRSHETYNIRVHTIGMAAQSWSFIEGQVLNANKQYLFAFGEDLWHETGRDADGYWDESLSDYDMDITFPKPGYYYLRFNTESNNPPSAVDIRISKQRGSSLPHFWFGLLSLLFGIFLNEMKNRTMIRLLNKME
jgi:hypothetical protein